MVACADRWIVPTLWYRSSFMQVIQGVFFSCLLSEAVITPQKVPPVIIEIAELSVIAVIMCIVRPPNGSIFKQVD